MFRRARPSEDDQAPSFEAWSPSNDIQVPSFNEAGNPFGNEQNAPADNTVNVFPDIWALFGMNSGTGQPSVNMNQLPLPEMNMDQMQLPEMNMGQPQLPDINLDLGFQINLPGAGDNSGFPSIENGALPDLPDFGNGEQPDFGTKMDGEQGAEAPAAPTGNKNQNSGQKNKNKDNRISAQAPQNHSGSDESRPEEPSDLTDESRPEKPSDMGNEAGSPGDMEYGMPGNGGGSQAPEEYEAAATVTEDASNTTYSSENDDQNAVLIDGSTVTLSGITVDKTGDSDGEDADFYGINAGILANNGAELTITDAEVTTDGAHANGVFSYGEGTTINVSNTEITTMGNNSGGLMTTGGGTLNASNVTISTSGNSSAAIRTDRGGGVVTVDESAGTTSGTGSPAIYSTADITVTNSTLTAENSEAVVIEGGNSVTITDSDLTGNNAKLNGQSTTATNVLIYQSMSGDASEGESEFTMTNGSLTAQTGSMFHVTNVTTTINLTNVALSYDNESENQVLLNLSADSWGTSGKNGGNATVNLFDQEAEGDITVDEYSSLTLNLTEDSSYTGAINAANTGSVSVTLENGSAWTLTGDSYIDSLDGDMSDINLNGYVLYIGGTAYRG